MHRLVKVGNMLVAAIDRQTILDQIVGANREKIDFFSQQISNQNSRRGLNHDADFDIFIEDNTFRDQVLPYSLKELLTEADLCYTGDHREHNAKRSERRSPENRPQLNPEQVNLFERESDGTQAHRRIHFIGEVELRNKLVTSDIQGSDRNRERSHLFHSRPVNTELVIF